MFRTLKQICSWPKKLYVRIRNLRDPEIPHSLYEQRSDFMSNVMKFVAGWRLFNEVGDYLEFGVQKGGSFKTAILTATRCKKRGVIRRGLRGMKFYAFDSFRGMPKPQGVDLEFNQCYEGVATYSLENFKKNLKLAGIDLNNNIEIIQGWFKDTLNEEIKKKLQIKSAAIVWIDCDQYGSTVPVLDFIKNYLMDGTVIVFNGWFLYRGNPNRGQQKAFYEWLEKNPDIKVTQYLKHHQLGNSFIIHK